MKIRVSAAAAAAALHLLFAIGCAEKRAPNVLLITVDTLRPDALGWVAGRNATPNIDALARGGFRFPAAVAPAPLTFPSHAAMFTGLLPRRLGLRDNGQVLGATPATLAELLKQRGYATAAFVSGYPLAAEFGLDRGFDRYDDELSSGEDPERPAAATTQRALAWLNTAQSPWFAWIHYYDPHYPYHGSYHAEVASVDAAIGTLRAAVRDANTLTIFAADHGESLGEHGEGTHGFFIYDSTIAVPLVFHFPDRIAPAESRASARLIDITPTVLDLLELPPLDDIDGINILECGGKAAAFNRGSRSCRPPIIPPAYIETYQPWTSYGWSPLRGIRHDNWKWIAAPRPELYDLANDRNESRNAFDRDHRKARELESVRRSITALPSKATPTSADDEALAKLRSLGYLGAGASTSEPPAHGLRDPKDGAAIRDLLTKADLALRAGRPEEAIPLFDAVLEQDADNRFALLRSGAALLAIGDAQTATMRLERAVYLDPQRVEARALIADALLNGGRAEVAVQHAMEVVRLQPRNAAAWARVGTALGLSRRPAEAVDAFARAVELEPRDERWLARLAFAQHGAGRPDAAVASLQRLASLTGEERFPHAGALGMLLLQMGRREEARRWLARSRPEEGDYADARRALAALQ